MYRCEILSEINLSSAIFIASVFGRHSMQGAAPYTISKYGVEAYSDSLRFKNIYKYTIFFFLLCEITRD